MRSVRAGGRLRVAILAGLLLTLAAVCVVVPSPVPSVAGGGPDQQAQPIDFAEDEVLIGAFLQNIQSIDPSTNSFLADLYIWLRWGNPDLKPYESLEVMNWYEAWQKVDLGTQTQPREQSDGSYYFALRYAGAFNSALSLVDFPFGTQQLHIILEDSEGESNQVRFIPDEASTGINPTITLPGYTIGNPTMAVSDFSYPTDFGDLDGSSSEIYSRATLSIPVSNPGLPNFIKYLLPIVLIVLAASLSFYLPPDAIEGRIVLGITALLTLVAMQWSATESLPTVSYLTMMDSLYLLGILFILASLFLGIRTTWVAREQSDTVAIGSDERMLVRFLVAFAVAFGGVLGAYLLV